MSVLAFDFGASSGRALLGELSDDKIQYKEIHRFANEPVNLCGTLYWDVLRLFREIKVSITKAVNEGGFSSIGIDTWGLDFGILDADGRLLENPVHYRDQRTQNIPEEVFSIISKEEIYSQTGIQTMRFNTLFQLYYLTHYRTELMSRADKILMMPDLFAYFLTGEKKCEYTNATTTQMFNPIKNEWADILQKLQINTDILPQIIEPKTPYGDLSDEICEELGCKKVPVIAICTHDTASAIAALPIKSDINEINNLHTPTSSNDAQNPLFLSCGTWSLMGTELHAPLINDKTMELNLTNEGGYGKSIRFLKNIMGLWLIQESRRQWIREGNEYSYAELEKAALNAEPFKYFIDPDSAEFETPGNIPKRIMKAINNEYFAENSEKSVPPNLIMRCIYESLAMKYRYVAESIQNVTGDEYDVIHIIGGGVKDKLLCQMTADFCGKKVIAGPIEATGIGNITVQLITLGKIKNLQSAREIIKNSFEPICYEPNKIEGIEAAYQRFLVMCQSC